MDSLNVAGGPVSVSSPLAVRKRPRNGGNVRKTALHGQGRRTFSMILLKINLFEDPVPRPRLKSSRRV